MQNKRIFRISTAPMDDILFILNTLEISVTSSAPNTFVATGTTNDFQKIEALLSLIDSNVPYTVETIAPLAASRNLPANHRISNALGHLDVGTFNNPPKSLQDDRAIIDIYHDAVIALIPTHRRDALLAYLKNPVDGPLAPVTQSIQDATDMAPQQDSMPEPPVKPKQRAQQILPLPIPRKPSTVTSTELSSQMPKTATNSSQANIDFPADNTTTYKQVNLAETAKSPQTDLNNVPEPSVYASQNTQVTPMSATVDPNQYRISLKNAQDKIDLTLPEQLSLIQLLGLAGEYLGLDYVYDAKKIPNDTITLKLHGQLQGELRVQDLYTLLETVLKFKGLAMVRGDDQLVSVVPLDEVMTSDPALIDGPNRILEPGDFVVTRVFAPQYTDAANIKTLLDTMKLSIAVSIVEQTQTVFVTCYAHRLARIERLVDMIDRPGRPRRYTFRQLNYTLAKEISEKIKTLTKELQDMPVILSSSPAANQRPVINPPDNPVTAPGGDSVYLDVDERTNRIIVIGHEQQLNLINDLVNALDVPLSDNRTPRVYHILHIEAAEIWEKVTTLLPQDSLSSRKTSQSSPPARITSRRVSGTDTAIENPSLPQVVVLDTINALLINASPEQHETIHMLIRFIDVAPQDQRTLVAYTIQNLDAAEIEAKLLALQLFEPPAGIPARLSSSQATTADTAQPAPPSQDSVVLATVPQITLLEVTNALLIHATPEQHQQIQAVIDYMDVEMQNQVIPYELYFLENQTPEHLAEILQKIIQETIINPEGKVESIVRNTDEQIIIVPDEQTFSLIVYANPKNQEWISKLIQRLDLRRPQVLIDVTLVEIRKTDEFNYDLNLVSSLPDLVETGGQTGSFLVNGQTVVEQLLSSSSRSRYIDLQSNSGLATGFYADTHINALLTMIQSKNYGRILAKPKVLVNDNETGVIKTTETTYVTKKSSIPVTSGGAGQNTTLVETAIDYEGYDAGITLQITPHASDGDLLRLDIDLNRSDFGNVTGEIPPDQSSSELNTVVTVPDGSTIILGGMIRLNQTKGGKKVPILGDLPLVGAAFRSASNTDIQNKLYIFVRAEIIRPEETLMAAHNGMNKISAESREAFEQQEKEFQDYELIPGLETEPTTPKKVLDAQ